MRDPSRVSLGGQGWCGVGLLAGRLVCARQRGAGAGKYVEAQVAAALDPLVVLFGQHGSNESNDRGPVGEDADHVGSAPDLSI